ncbi:DUF3987 domain-containing protein [Candidatus Parcubacteria bacterium]|nr:MAG: DUF3987 domain-containing protein [Candidatus Parcubacteria bacterium]
MNYLPHQLAVPKLPGLLGAIQSDLSGGQVDPVIVTAIIQQFMTTLTQGIADVRLPNGIDSRIGNNGFLIAPPVSGKSLITTILKDPIERALAELVEDSSSKSTPEFFLEDTSKEAIVSTLMAWPYCTLISEEFGAITNLLKGHSAQARLNKLLDSTSLHHARVKSGNVKLKDYRFSAHLAGQPAVFDEIKSLLGIGKRSNGLVNRFCFSQGGWRVTHSMALMVRLSDQTLRRYEATIRTLLTANIQQANQANPSRTQLTLTEQAERLLQDYERSPRSIDFSARDKVAAEQIQEYLSRSGERIRRFATAMHVFESGATDKVSEYFVSTAISFDQYWSNTFQIICNQSQKLSEFMKDVMTVENSVRQFIQQWGYFRLPLKDIRSNCINLGLTKYRLDKVLAHLGSEGKIRSFKDNDDRIWIEVANFFNF